VGVEVSRPPAGGQGSPAGGSGSVYLDYLTWDGAPHTVLAKPPGDGVMWQRAWVNGVDQYEGRWWEAFRVIHNSGRGLLMQGGRDWTDYRVTSTITFHLAEAAGLAARVQGMRRYYALLLRRGEELGQGKAQLIKALDGDTVLAEVDFPWEFGATHELSLTVQGNRIVGSIDGQALLTADDGENPLAGGGIAFVVEEGRIMSDAVAITPLA
jgi:hypothetical protein